MFSASHTVYVAQFLNRSLDVTTMCSAAAAVVVAMVRVGLPGGSRCVRLMPGIQLTALNQRRYAGCHYGDVRTLSMTRTRRLDCLLSRHIARRPAWRQRKPVNVVNWGLVLMSVMQRRATLRVVLGSLLVVETFAIIIIIRIVHEVCRLLWSSD